MMLAALLSALFLLASPLPGRPSVRIREVGLGGYYAVGSEPTRVTVELTNPSPHAEMVELRLKIIARPPYDRIYRNVDSFTKTIKMNASEQRTWDIPVVFSTYQSGLVTAELHDAGGQLIGADQKVPESPATENLVAIVCSDDAICKEAQTEMTFSGNQASQAAKAKGLKFVVVRDAPPIWWAYSAAGAVVVTGPTERLDPDQQQALELYARQGGHLVLVEEAGGNHGFLSPYRAGAPSGSAQILGDGRLYRVGGLKTQMLGQLFSGSTPEVWSTRNTARIAMRFHPDMGTYLLHRLGTRFTFPGLGWLLLWLTVYILCVGPLNFAILNRWRRREWGWVTVPAISLLFSVILYASSAARRPKEFRADEVSLYWMDDASPVAAVEESVRVSAPRRAETWLALPGDVVFAGENNQSGFLGTSGFMVDPPGEDAGTSVRLDPPEQVRLRLLQWSFRDTTFADFRTLPGTVHRAGPGRLRNETGLTFTKAIYVDTNHVYFLGRVAAGADIDLTKVRQAPLKQETGRSFGYPQPLEAGEEAESNQTYAQSNPTEAQKEFEEQRTLPERPFDPVELIRGWPRGGGRTFTARSGLFGGLAEGGAGGAWLMNMMSARMSWIVVVVSLEPVHD
jgi:hypothetical protein